MHGRVAAPAHLVAARRELFAELGEVVELAVEDRDDVAGLARDRLVAELRVDHLQPLMAEHARAEGVRRALIRAAVADARAHGVDERAAAARPTANRVRRSRTCATVCLARPVAIVSCHLEQPLRDDTWARFDELQRRRPGGFDVIALMRPPDAAYGEDDERWLDARAHRVAARPVRLAHALDEPDACASDRRRSGRAGAEGGGVAARAGARAAVLLRRRLVHRRRGARTVRELGLVDCTERGGGPRAGRAADDAFARTARARSASAAARLRACVLPRLRPARREAARSRSLRLCRVLGRRRRPGDALALAR